MPSAEGGVWGRLPWLRQLSREEGLGCRAQGRPARAAWETRKAKPPQRADIGRASCDVPWQRPQGFSLLLGETEATERADNPDPDWHVLLFAFYDVSIVDGLISLLHKVSPIWPGHRINSL